MKAEKVKINLIKSHPNNPRLIKDDKFKKLVESVSSFPQMMQLRPIVVDETMTILGGNMRLKACIEAGFKEVWIVKASELTEEQKKEFIIKDNVGFGEWDWDMLANEWSSNELESWGLDIPIFEDSVDISKDLSSTINPLYRIEVSCTDEESQENTYNKLIEQGLECRLLTL
jgi:ParB-like chromosome segregation protein Spo0J